MSEYKLITNKIAPQKMLFCGAIFLIGFSYFNYPRIIYKFGFAH